MRDLATRALVLSSLALAIAAPGGFTQPGLESAMVSTEVRLPPPALAGALSLEQALARRRSVREFSAADLSSAELGQLLWAAQGVTDAEGHRTAPSAGALCPLELCVVRREGLFRYLPQRHALVARSVRDLRGPLAQAALGQECVRDAPVDLVITGVVARTAVRYGPRAERYVLLEAGHAAQNIHLQAVALGLGSVPVGAFDDEAVAEVLGLPDGERPLYIIPVGRPRD